MEIPKTQSTPQFPDMKGLYTIHHNHNPPLSSNPNQCSKNTAKPSTHITRIHKNPKKSTPPWDVVTAVPSCSPKKKDLPHFHANPVAGDLDYLELGASWSQVGRNRNQQSINLSVIIYHFTLNLSYHIISYIHLIIYHLFTLYHIFIYDNLSTLYP